MPLESKYCPRCDKMRGIEEEVSGGVCRYCEEPLEEIGESLRFPDGEKAEANRKHTTGYEGREMIKSYWIIKAITRRPLLAELYQTKVAMKANNVKGL